MNIYYVLPEVSRMRTFQSSDAKDKRIRELEREVARLRKHFKAPATECSICRSEHGIEIIHECE